MKQKLLLLILGVLLSLPAMAESPTKVIAPESDRIAPTTRAGGNFEYTYEGQTVIYTILDEEAKTCRTAEGYFKGSDKYAWNEISGDLVLPEHPIFGWTEYTLTEIGNYSFIRQTGLTSIEIPESVTSIGEDAFRGCKGLTSVIIPKSVTKIGKESFYDCTRLKKSAYPNNLSNPFNYGIKVAYDPEVAIIEDGWIWGLDKSAIYFAPFNLKGEYVIPNSVTYLADYAFSGCTDLTSAVLPNSVTLIGGSAFSGCSALSSVVLPNSVTSIGSEAFYQCSGLTSVVIPNSVSFIGSDAFKYCNGLKKSAYPNNLYNPFSNGVAISYKSEGAIIEDGWIWGPDKSVIYFAPLSLEGEFKIPNSVTSIGSEAFCYCSGLTSVVIPNSVTSIGDGAFYSCKGLTEMLIPNSVTSIGSDSFKFCSGLASVEIPNSVNSIADGVFYGCSGLTSVEIPNSVNSIGASAFDHCSGLTSVEIPNSVISIGSEAFSGCSGLTSAIIPNSVTSIGDYAFRSCSGLTSAIIPNSVSSIGKSAFYGCSGLKKSAYPNTLGNPFSNGIAISYNPDGAIIDDGWIWGPDRSAIYFAPLSLEGEFIIPNSVSSIGDGAFRSCSGLKSSIIPNSVSSIGKSAFYECSGLTSVVIPNSVTSIGSDAFKYCNGLIKSAYPSILGNPFSNGIAISYNPEGAIIEDGWIWGPDKLAIYFAPLSLEGQFKIPNSVSSIGKAAFYECSGLTSVVISNSVVSIGNEAFVSCNNLTSLTFNAEKCQDFGSNVFPKSIKTLVIGDKVTLIPPLIFSGLNKLTSVNIPDSVSEIGYSAFLGCQNLTDITIPNSVTSIGDAAFSDTGLTSLTFNAENCEYCGSVKYPVFPSSLETLLIGDKVAIIPANTWYGCNKIPNVIIPNSVKSIGDSAFAGCEGLVSIDIPNSVTSIGDSAFAGCEGLVSLMIPKAVSSIGSYAFAGCDNVTSLTFNAKKCEGFGSNVFPNGIETVDIGEEVTIIPKNCFNGLNKLPSVKIPDSVTSIGDRAFADCSGLTSLEIGNSVQTIGVKAFENCSSVPSIVLPPTIKELYKNSFDGCSGLIKSAYPNNVENPFERGTAISYNPEGAIIEDGCIWGPDKSAVYFASLNLDGEYTIPETVTSIGASAFEKCSSLTSVMIPNSVTSIGERAFSNCSAMTSVEIGNSLETLGYMAFYGCVSLTSVVLPPTLQSFYYNSFEGCSGLIKSAYPSGFKDNPFKNGLVINYEASGAIVENGFVFGPDKSVIYFAPLNLAGEYSIPEYVNAITKDAFVKCDGLSSIIAPWSQPAQMNDDAFKDLYSEVSLSVPSNSVANYLATNWSLFKNICTDSGAEVKTYSDGVLEYRLNPADMSAVVIGAKSYGNLQIPERFTDDSDSANPVRYYIKSIGYKAFQNKSVESIEFNSRSQIEHIGDYAFSGCNFTKISLPETITSIGEGAFQYSSLMNAELKEGLQSIGTYSFAETKLTSISIPESVSSLGDHAFYKSPISDIEIKEGVPSIGNYAFAETKLSSINVPGSVTTIGDYAFYKTPITKVEIEEGVQSIGNYAFAETKLSSISIPASVKAIEDYAFYKMEGLSAIWLHEGLVSIGRNAFASEKEISSSYNLYMPSTLQYVGFHAFENFKCSQVDISSLDAWLNIDFGSYLANPLGGSGDLYVNEKKLTNLQIPEGVKEVKPYTFYNCKSLEEIVLPEGLEKIGINSFHSCTGVNSLTIPSSVVEIGRYVFRQTNVTFSDGLLPISFGEGAFYNGAQKLYWGRPMESLNIELKDLESFEVGGLITEIPEGKFKGLTKLNNLKFSANLQSIGDEAFSACTSLKEVILPPNLENIGASAFAGNSELASIIMGHSMKSIGDKAFDGCPANTVSITAQTPPTAPNTTFSNYKGKLYVQGEKAKDAYYDAYTCWDRFDSYVMIDAEEIKLEGAENISGKAGDTFQLTATIWPENVTLPKIFWRSTNPEIATVDQNGLVTLHVDLQSLKTRAQGDSDINGICTIIAETLYNDGPVVQVAVDGEINAVKTIFGSSHDNGTINYNEPYDVYNLNGLKVADSKDNLAKGMYIIRQGKAAAKIMIND